MSEHPTWHISADKAGGRRCKLLGPSGPGRAPRTELCCLYFCTSQ